MFVEREPVSGPRFREAESPEIGEQLRTYRLALITDPGYSDYFGGPPNVTPAKVALMNRVDQVYEDDMSIRLQLIANNDLLNLDTWGQATAPNGPCGAAACFTQPQVTGCSSTTRARYVIGQIIGASNYDIGHLALGEPGGGVANLGVVGRSNKAGGCTGVPTPVGDLYAIDYVAHEMGHQFAGNHTFNGNQLNCSGGNRNGPTSVEPGSGQSIMAYAGICLTDDEQPHSDGYFSERSQQEINTYVSSSQAPINEVQTVSLRHFGGGNETQVVTFGPGYAKTASITPLSLTINAAPSATSRGGAQETGDDRHDRHELGAHAPGRGHGDGGRRRGARLQRHIHGDGCPVDTLVPVHERRVRAPGVRRRHRNAGDSGRELVRDHRDDPHERSARALGRRRRGDQRRRRRRVQRDVHGHGRSEPDDVPVHDREPSRPTRAAGRRRTSRRSRCASAATTRC